MRSSNFCKTFPFGILLFLVWWGVKMWTKLEVIFKKNAKTKYLHTTMYIFYWMRSLMTEGDRYATKKTFLSAFLVSQAEDEGIDRHHVGWFQELLQFGLLHPEQSRVWIVGWSSVCQDGFEEEHLSSDWALCPSSSGQFVLIDTAGSVAEESRLETVSCRKENRLKVQSEQDKRLKQRRSRFPAFGPTFLG